MKRILFFLLAIVLMGVPIVRVEAGRGDGAAIAAGLIGTAVITSAVASGSSSRARRAEDEAIRAREKAEAVRQEQQRERLYNIQRQVERQSISQESGKTINMLIFAVVMLFLGIISLAIIILRKK